MKTHRLMRFIAVQAAIVVMICAGGTITNCRLVGSGVSAGLTLHERSGVARDSEPVTSGVPIPRSSNIKSSGELKVVDSAGNSVPAQFEVTSRWGGAPGNVTLPIRWVLVDFQGSVGAGGTTTYYLQSGGSGNTAGTNLRVTRNDSGYLDISTGAARFSFNKNSFNIFDSVYAGSSQIIAPGSSSYIRAVDSGGAEFLSTYTAPTAVLLECDGPVRKTVKIVGKLSNGAGKLLDYTARISLFNNSSAARLSLSIANRRDPRVVEGQPDCWDIGCANSATFRDLTLKVESTAAGGGTSKVGGRDVAEFQVDSGSLNLYQDSSGASNWDRHRGNNPRPDSYVSFRGYRTYVNGSQAASGNQPEPWIASSGPGGGLKATVRDFWQNYPKALRASGRVLEVSLFPDEYSGNYSLRPQEQKTHEVLLSFFGPGAAADAASSQCLAFQDPLFAEASASYYLSTGAFGRVSGLSGDSEFAAYEELNRSTLDGTSSDGAAQNLYRAIDDASFYSWQNYGEVPIDYENGGTASFNDKYNFGLGMMLQYARSGDFRWFRLAEAGGKHTADIDILHYQGNVDIWWKGGFFGHGYHDEDGNANPNRNYGAPHPDLSFAAPALFMLYYMTGDRVAYDSAVEVAENTRYRFGNSFGRGNNEGFAESYDYENECNCCRPFAHGLWIFVDAYRATGNESYLASAEWLIRDSRTSTDMFITAPVPGDRRYKKLFTWDLLEFSLGRYLDLTTEMGRNDPSGARELLLAMTAQEAERMWQTDAAGNKGVPYAWMRDGTPWGWEDTEVKVNVCNWHLLTADALTYGYLYGGDASLLDRAREAFKTGSNPNLESYRPQYTATKEATNSANFGQVYMHYRNPPADVPGSAQFNEWLCLENPGAAAANVRITYYMGGGENLTEVVTVPPRSRSTIDVNRSVGWGRDVSATVESSRPIVAERPMYFNYHGALQGGHDETGSVNTAEKWYFAEGCTREGFEQWMTIENANGTDASVTLTYMLEAGGTRIQKIRAPARSRTTVSVNDYLGPGQDLSTLVESTLPLTVERPMYFNYRGKWAGGHDVLGANAPSAKWYFAEGSTRSNPDDGQYEPWLCLQNPNNEAANAQVSYMLSDGNVIVQGCALPPRSRKTIDIGLAIGPNRDTSIEVLSDRPLVAERPMYYAFRNAWQGGHAVMGVTGASKQWHFAEGCSRDGFNTWLCLGNPGGEEATVTVDYYLGTGQNITRQVSVPPRSRRTVDVNLDNGPGQDISTRVTSTIPILAERPMYFNYHNAWAGGHDSTGATSTATTWHFAEGCTL